MTTIAIIGVGKLGTRLAEQLVLDHCGKRLLLDNRSKPRLHGVVRSLEVWAKLSNSDVTIEQVTDTQASTIADLVVISVKENYDPRLILNQGVAPAWLKEDLRSVGLTLDLPQLRRVCNSLSGYTGLIAVVTNPVDVMTSCVAQWVPTARVFGLGASLDSARLEFVVARELNLEQRDLSLPVGGTHGSELVPLNSLWMHRGRSFSISTVDSERFVREATRLGVEIVEDIGYTLQDCAVVFAADIGWLLAHSRLKGWPLFSIAEAGVCTGWPAERLADGTIQMYQGLPGGESQSLRAARDSVGGILQHLRTERML